MSVTAIVERFATQGAGWKDHRESPWWGVHASRYLFAKPYVAGRHVLDIACGTGYGLPVLASTAKSVVGVDVEVAAVVQARAEQGKAARMTLVADGRHLPFRDDSFTAVTTFETLEHLHDRRAFVSELARVLTPDGVMVLSTPNAHYTQPVNGKPHNQFHVYEYTPDQLRAELAPFFGEIELMGQALNPRFIVSPFWTDQERMPKTVRMRSRRFVWRVLNRLPGPLRDGLARTLWGHQLVPGENDYVFAASHAATAPVTVAICRKPITRG